MTNWRAGYIERCTSGSEEGNVKPVLETGQGVCFLSYDPSPSREDIMVTEKMVEGGKLLGIDVLDHIIIGDGKYVSLKDEGFVK